MDIEDENKAKRYIYRYNEIQFINRVYFKRMTCNCLKKKFKNVD